MLSYDRLPCGVCDVKDGLPDPGENDMDQNLDSQIIRASGVLCTWYEQVRRGQKFSTGLLYSPMPIVWYVIQWHP